MLGGLIIAFVLLVVFPPLAIMGCGAIAVGLGSLLNHDNAVRHEGSELAELNA